MNYDLTGKVALVTGSTRGIGFATALGLAKMGAHVIVNGRSQDAVSAAVQRGQGILPDVAFEGIAADLVNVSDVCRLFDRFPFVDILVNNLGVYSHKTFFEITDAEWTWMFTVNVMTGVRTTRHYLKHMLERGWGRIVNVGSESGVFIPPEMIHYGVTKAAQLAFSRGVAELTVGTDVTINSVLPGPTLVETVNEQVKQRAQAQGVDEKTLMSDTFKVRRPSSLLKRYTTAEEVASMICYLCTPAASATNGAPLRAEGGIIRTYF